MNSGYTEKHFISTGISDALSVCSHFHSPSIAFVACHDTASVIRERVIAMGMSLARILVLSVKDTPALGTADAIFQALPPTVGRVAIDDIEYLLPPDQRTLNNVLTLGSDIDRLAASRGLLEVHATFGTSNLLDEGVAA